MTDLARPNVYVLLTDDVLERELLDLERIASQPGFRLAPQPTQNFYLGKLDQARAELERRRT